MEASSRKVGEETPQSHYWAAPRAYLYEGVGSTFVHFLEPSTATSFTWSELVFWAPNLKGKLLSTPHAYSPDRF